MPLSAIRPSFQDKIIEEMSKHYVSSSDISSGRGTGISMDDLDNVFERELKKDEFTDSKEYIVSFVRNFNLSILLTERERAMSVFSAESQTPPPELDVGLGENQGENPQILPVEEQLLSQKLPIGKSKKHVMPPSSVRVEKEVTAKTSTTKKSRPTPKPKLAPLSMVKESVEMGPEVAPAAAAAAAAPKPKKPRQKGLATLKLNPNPIEEDTPSPAPLLLPTFQAKTGSKKLKPISMGASVASAAADQPPQNPEGKE